MIQNLTMVRGDTASFGVEIEGLNQDLSSAFFTCRQGFQGAIVFQKSIGDGISKVGDGQYVYRIAPEDTENLPIGEYFYDAEISANGDRFTFLSGTLSILNESTY